MLHFANRKGDFSDAATLRGVPTYVALLRGINLGARNKVGMADLRALFEALGHENVATYVQSGNVVFKSAVRSAAELNGRIEERIARDLGLTVTVLIRTKAELGKVAAGNPLAKDAADTAHLHVTFLADAPERARVRDLEDAYDGPDAFRVVGREVYLCCPNGYGRSKLSNAFLEKRLGTVATTRNWKTVSKLAELATT
jgi:uncharacterized protein (DUF1697 family)